MKTNNHKNQQGVVLIACLVFLVLILGLLRISLGSSLITEKKSGIDLDMLDAKESAETVIRTAINSLVPSADPSIFPACADGENTKKCLRARILTAKNDWKSKTLSSTTNLSASNGYYDGNKQYDQCGKGSPENRPLWQCVNWGNEFHKSYGVTQSLNPIRVGRNAYIVESFPPEEYGITSGTGTKSILLRITALGVGNPTPDGRPTNVMLQADYLLQ